MRDDRDLVRAMIGTAKMDGRIDDGERENIPRQMDALDLDAESRAFLDAEFSSPLDIERIVASAICPEKAAEIYAASLLAADARGPAERGFLAMLAARLNLAPGLVAHINANMGAGAPEH